MSEWNDEHYFTKTQKAYMLFCSLIIALCIAYVTHLYFEYRVVNALWETTFVSPEAFWEGIPKAEWKPIFVDGK